MWWAAAVQSLGTLFFNVTTFRALQVAISNPSYDKLVWRPDPYGSVCFLISGVIVYRGFPPTRQAPATRRPGLMAAAVNLLCCLLFGIAAALGYVVGSSSWILDQAAANLSTSAGRRASSHARWRPLARSARRLQPRRNGNRSRACVEDGPATAYLRARSGHGLHTLRGVELEVIAIELPDCLLIIHVMPRAHDRRT